MSLDKNELRLVLRALRYSVAHLNVAAQDARTEGRTHEAIACAVESEQLSSLAGKLNVELISILKGEKSKSVDVTPRRVGGCGAECSNLCATGSCPSRQSD